MGNNFQAQSGLVSNSYATMTLPTQVYVASGSGNLDLQAAMNSGQIAIQYVKLEAVRIA